MKAERIGRTPRDELKWAIREAYRTEPRTEGDWSNYGLEAALFAGVNPLAHLINSDQYRADTLSELHRMLEAAVAHQTITDLPRPYAPTLVWDEAAHRYKKQEPHASEVFETRFLGHLGDLILAYGHLLKICPAPAKMKPGRKAKDVQESPRGTCRNRFLAIKETQLYCSSACLDRALKSRKKPKPAKPKVKKKKKR